MRFKDYISESKMSSKEKRELAAIADSIVYEIDDLLEENLANIDIPDDQDEMEYLSEAADIVRSLIKKKI